MACFLVPAAEAAVMTAVYFKVKKTERETLKFDGSICSEKKAEGAGITDTAAHGIPWSRKIGWLLNLLWGGAFLLLFEHIWHGEVILSPPFLTAMSSSSDTAAMLHEMSTVGVAMAAFVTAIWVVMIVAADARARKGLHQAAEREDGSCA